MSSRKRHDSSSASDSSSSSASGKESESDSDSSNSSSPSSGRERKRNSWRTAERKISPVNIIKGYGGSESGEITSSDEETPGKLLKSSVQRPSRQETENKITLTQQQSEEEHSEEEGERSDSKRREQDVHVEGVGRKEDQEKERRKDSKKSRSDEEEDEGSSGNKEALRQSDVRQQSSRRDRRSRSREVDISRGERDNRQRGRTDDQRRNRSPGRQQPGSRRRSRSRERNRDMEDSRGRDRRDRDGDQRNDRQRDRDYDHRKDRDGDRSRRERRHYNDKDKENRDTTERRQRGDNHGSAQRPDRKRTVEDSDRQDPDGKPAQGETNQEQPPAKKPKSDDTLATRTGGAYIPPARLRMMQAQITDKSSVEYQRIAWEALKKSINGLINKVNTSNIIEIVKELFQENIVRGRGLLARSIIQAQAASPTFTSVYAALVAIINTKFPQNGELILRRLILQFRRGFRRNDKNVCLSSTRFVAHLVNQQVAHEVLSLEILTLLLETPTDDSVEVSIGFLKECGQKLTEVSPRGINAIFERLRNILHEGQIDKRVQYMVEVMFAVRKDGFKDHVSVVSELDLVEEDDQFTHLLTLEEAGQAEDILNVFKADPDFIVNEDKYKTLKKEILDEDSSDGESGSGSGEEESSDEEGDEQEEEDKQKIIDQTETNLVALRRTIYLTIQSSLDFEECAHKILRMDLKVGQEVEVCNMILDCCAQQRTYEKFYGLLAQRFCQVDRKFIEPFQNIFKEQYETIHRLETNKLRNVAKFFSHLLHTDAIAWGVLSCVLLNEDDTTSASRIFVKILFQELSEYMGLPKLNDRLKDPTLQVWFEGIMPRDNPKNTRFAINFFTTIGLGGLTDDLREHLRNMSKQLMQQKQLAEPESGSSSDDDSDSSSDDDDSSSSSDSDSDDSSDSSSDSDSSDDQKKKKKKASPKKKKNGKDKPKQVANGLVRDSDIFSDPQQSYSDPWDRQRKGPSKNSRREEKSSRSSEKSSRSSDKNSRSDDKRSSDKSSRSKENNSRSGEKMPRSGDRSPRLYDKKPRSDHRSPRSNERNSRSNNKSSRSGDKSSRTEDSSSRSDDKHSRSDDRRPRSDDKHSRTNEKSSKSNDRTSRSDDKLSRVDEKRSRSGNKGSRSNDISRSDGHQSRSPERENVRKYKHGQKEQQRNRGSVSDESSDSEVEDYGEAREERGRGDHRREATSRDVLRKTKRDKLYERGNSYSDIREQTREEPRRERDRKERYDREDRHIEKDRRREREDVRDKARDSDRYRDAERNGRGREMKESRRHDSRSPERVRVSSRRR